MLIVLEGCDGSGKTTLANVLATILDAEIIHCTTKTPNTFCWFDQIIEASKTRNIIADRFCYGQFVYQKPEERQLSNSDLYELEVHMVAAGAKVIFVDANTATIMNRLKSRGEVTDLSVDEIRDRYTQVFTDSCINVTVVKTDTSSSPKKQEKLEDKISPIDALQEFAGELEKLANKFESAKRGNNNGKCKCTDNRKKCD